MKWPSLWLSTGGRRLKDSKTRKPGDSETRLPDCRKNQICDADFDTNDTHKP